MSKKIFYGNIITLDDNDTFANAVCVDDGKITYVGSKEGAQRFKTNDTIVIDFGKNSVYPGFMDAHIHGTVEANELCGYVDLSNGTNKKEYLDIMREFIKKNPGRSTYVGSNWLLQRVDMNELSYKDLDELSTTARIYMMTEDKHIVWVNSKVLNDCDISMFVDKKKKDNGIFADAVALRIVSNIELPIDVSRQGYIEWQKEAFSLGYTAVSEAAVIEMKPTFMASRYSELVKTGIWKLRTYAVYLVQPNDANWSSQIDYAKECAKKFNSEYFKICGIKLFADGIVEAHTAWMLEDYADRPGYRSECLINDYDNLVKLIEKANKLDLLVHVHCIGDAATQFITKAMVEAQSKTHINDARNIIAHLECVDKKDIELMSKNNIIACVAPLWVPKNPLYNRLEEDYLGKERQESLFPIKSFWDAGAKVVFHSDYPGASSASIPDTIFRAVTRYDHKFGTKSSRNPNDSVTRKQALYSLTRNTAYSFKEEKRLGTIEVGKIANFTVFDKDFLKCPIEEIPHAKVVNTIVDGEIVF